MKDSTVFPLEKTSFSYYPIFPFSTANGILRGKRNAKIAVIATMPTDATTLIQTMPLQFP
ncbi:hypothetical protein HY285_00290 [Candidatus Peregrinibacteria bacterium]|nr:hypothetical protein [Candidatus Peregrinibacteria bacterium]